MANLRTILLATSLLLAACGKPAAVAEGADNVEGLPAANSAAPSPTGAPPANASTATPAQGGASAAAIPAALQGHWGLTPRDCTSTLGDAKGLLIVNPTELRFYESRAVPAPGVQTSADSISGNFAFTGEGQEWVRHETLEVRGGKLIRTERDPVASFSYVRC